MPRPVYTGKKKSLKSGPTSLLRTIDDGFDDSYIEQLPSDLAMYAEDLRSRHMHQLPFLNAI